MMHYLITFLAHNVQLMTNTMKGEVFDDPGASPLVFFWRLFLLYLYTPIVVYL
jgi:hypothetical protein